LRAKEDLANSIETVLTSSLINKAAAAEGQKGVRAALY
jgi:hypothetical protein